MRSFTFREVDREEFDKFSARHPEGNFQQTSKMGDVHAADGAEVSFLGVEEDGRLVAATEFEVHRSRLSTFAEIHNGPLCDFHDAELTKFLFSNLRNRAKQAGCAQLEITPEAPYRYHATDGSDLPNPDSDEPWPDGVPKGLPTGADNEGLSNIVACGFKHEGFDHVYNAVPRWRYLKDLKGIHDTDELMASFLKNTRRNIRIAEHSFVTVKSCEREELETLHKLCQMSSDKQGFENRSLDYFELVYDGLGNDAELLIAYMDTAAYLRDRKDRHDRFVKDASRIEQQAKEMPSSKKVQRRLADAREKCVSSVDRIREAQELVDADGTCVPVAGAMFVWGPKERVYLFSGSNPHYDRYCGATAIQYRAISDTVARGLPRYNFYGINGVFGDPRDPGHGLLEFKQGFGGYIEEMMGSFTMPIKPITYAAKQLAHRILGR